MAWNDPARDTSEYRHTPSSDAIDHHTSRATGGDNAQRPRLLVLTSTYPRWHGDPEPGFVHELAKRLVGRFDVMVLCPHAVGAKRTELFDGVQVRRYAYAPARWETLVNEGGILANLSRHTWKWLLLPGFVLAQWLQVLTLRRVWRPGIVHAHWLLPQGIVAAASGAGPVVVTSHGADLFALKTTVFRWLRIRVAKRAAAVTVVSDAMRMRLQAECPEANVLTMPMGVDLDGRFNGESNGGRSTSTILFVGRLVPKKGLVHLIDAMPAVLAARPDARLNVVGFGPELDRLIKRVVQLDIGASVRFVGAVSQSELPSYYRSAAVFVAPFVEAASGDQEGLGLVVAEAIGCHCPVVVGDVPAVHDFFGNDTECLVPQGDSAAIARAILGVLDDPQAAQKRALALRERVLARFSWERVADDYANLFERVMQRKQRT